jgi:hypothetical protein
MAKIVDINENDLKRIVKRVLSERRILNENTLGKGEVNQNTLDAFKTAISSGKDPFEKLESVVDACSSNSEDMGPPKQSDSAISAAASKVWEGINEGSWYTFGAGTDEDKIKKGIASMQSIPDLCAMIKKYSDTYEEFYDSIDSDFDSDNDLGTYVVAPISNIITKQTSGPQSSTGTSAGPVVGGGNTPVPTGSVTPNPSARGDGDVEDLQRLLKNNGFDIGRGGVDGSFGDDTLYATLKALRTYLK